MTVPEGWSEVEGALERDFRFDGFLAALEFVDRVAALAEAADHHPDIEIHFSRVRLRWWTHTSGGITARDHDLAARTSELVEGGSARASFTVPLALLELPADDLARGRRFWEGLLAVSLTERTGAEGSGLQTGGEPPLLGLHERGAGPGDRSSLPYFRVAELTRALERVVELGGNVVHPGERWAVCRDSEGNPFGLAAE